MFHFINLVQVLMVCVPLTTQAANFFWAKNISSDLHCNDSTNLLSLATSANAYLMSILSFVNTAWSTVFSPSAVTFSLESLSTNWKHPHSQNASWNNFGGPSGRRSLSPGVSPSRVPVLFALTTFKRLLRRLDLQMRIQRKELSLNFYINCWELPCEPFIVL